jgi:hypothetical protein
MGDYVYAPGSGSTSGGFIPTHGFLVVGKGPALDCDSDLLLTGQHIGRNVILGNFNVPSDHPDRLNFFGQPISDVFYVVDVPGIQRGTARPFYCSVISDKEKPGLDNYFGLQNAWVFYRVPNSINVPCERIFEPPFGRFSSQCPK